MTKRMLIDATHAEETRVVVLDGTRLEDFDVETSTKQQLKGNIYLAKVVRVEPSLQAAFVEYGGNRHGFLAFGEIHPDYYQIPVADRLALIAQQEEEARLAEAEEDAAAAADAGEGAAEDAEVADAPAADAYAEAGNPETASAEAVELVEVPGEPAEIGPDADGGAGGGAGGGEAQPERIVSARIVGAAIEAETVLDEDAAGESAIGDDSGVYDTAPEAALIELGLVVAADGAISGEPEVIADLVAALETPEDDEAVQGEDGEGNPPAPVPETLGGDSEGGEERERRPRPSRSMRAYKIQEVIRRRQIMLVQVVKEERGGKGAALTTYISLAGRFCVLMPNSPRGGGISRKITSASDRRRLKEVTAELGLPAGMGLIVRTAGAARPKPEITRDCEYLLQLWDDIRENTLKSSAPAAIYEEASLIKRAIRDVYSRDVEEVLVDGEAAWRAARDQMRLLMPSHASKVQLWHDPTGAPLFAKYAVDAQLDAMMSPNVQLRSGGYLVINQTEALVAVDVNSGRSTRERGIEETALRTNMEAAEELARQLRLRDLAGLIVIDFIDMEVRKHNAMVEKKLSEALKNDRARIQLGSISHFGLMEMSRQRLRPSLTETNFVQCAHCGGAGHVRSTEGSAIQVLRAIEEEGAKRRSAEIMVHVAPAIAMYILNHKRERLREIEARSGMAVVFTPDASLLPPALRIEKLRAYGPGEAPVGGGGPAPVLDEPDVAVVEENDEAFEDVNEAGEAEEAVGEARGVAGEGAAARAEGEGARRRRRRRRRGGRREDAPRADGVTEETGPEAVAAAGEGAVMAAPAEDLHVEMGEGALHVAHGGEPARSAEEGSSEGGGRRRGRRGGRRRRREGGEGSAEPQGEAAEAFAAEESAPVAYSAPAYSPPVYSPPAYSGPTPADPFGGGGFDIFDVMEMAEKAAEAAAFALTLAPTPVAAVVAPPAPVPEPEPVLAEPEVVAAEPAVRVPAKRRSRAKAKPVVEEAPVAVPEPEPEPLVKPVMVEDAPAAPKRGWWRK